MSFLSATNLGSVLVLTAVLTGCNPLYMERTTKISPAAGDAIATNKMTHMVDPWPRHSANRDIAFSGAKMQTAVERYRTDKVTVPVNATTSSTQYQRMQPVVLSTGGGKP